MKKLLNKLLNKEIKYPDGSTLTVGESFFCGGLFIFSFAVMAIAVIVLVKSFVQIAFGR
jgi:hypothetical protein